MSTLVQGQAALLIAMAVVSAGYFCWTLIRYLVLRKSFLTHEEIIPSKEASFWIRMVFAVLAIAFIAVNWSDEDWGGRIIYCFFAIGFYAEGIHVIHGLVIILLGILRGVVNMFVSLCKDFFRIYRLICKLFVHKCDKE